MLDEEFFLSLLMTTNLLKQTNKRKGDIVNKNL